MSGVVDVSVRVPKTLTFSQRLYLPQILAGIGIATALLGFLFVVYSTPPRTESIGQEMVR